MNIMKAIIQHIKIFILWVIILLSSCVETYDFEVEDVSPTLVIESYLSNISYNESLSWPSSGRFFSVKLSLTSNVASVHNSLIDNALITLRDDLGNTWAYYRYKPGLYILPELDFKAEQGRSYQLRVVLSDESIYESEWQEIPTFSSLDVGEISFIEDEEITYVWEANDKVVGSLNGVRVYVQVPDNAQNDKRYYRWEYEPMWQYTAPEASSSEEGYRCWVRSDTYLSDYSLLLDQNGGYKKEMFFIPIEGNNRVYELFTVLISQQQLSKDHFYFWELMKEQSSPNGIFDGPPTNLPANFTCLNNDKKVIGYFGIVNESVKRWYFDINDLSYDVFNDNLYQCQIDYGPPAGPTECEVCLLNSKGDATNIRPWWWPNE